MGRVLYFKNFFLRFVQKIFHWSYVIKRIKGKRVCDKEEANAMISEFLLQGTAFSLLRPGNGEYSFAADWNEHVLFGTNRYKRQKMYEILRGSDSFSSRWVNDMQNAVSNADIIALFNYDSYMEKFLIEAYGKEYRIMRMEDVEGIGANRPWTLALEGKKVLFVSPFAKDMESQYTRIDKIWPDKIFLPNMQAKFVESVWFTMGDDCGFADWYEALDCLYNRIKDVDYDVAILGCGPFAIHLTDMIKRDGKTAIQVGGALQLWFGIRGQRWDDDPDYDYLYNEFWIRPEKKKAPSDMKALDGGCYW